MSSPFAEASILRSVMALSIASDGSLRLHLQGVLQDATEASLTSSKMLAIPQLESHREQECIIIRQRILSYLDIGDLNRAIQASPLFLQAFRPQRKQLLLCALFNTLGMTILEAFAVHRATSLDFQASRSKEKVALFLESLRKHKQKPNLTLELCTFFSEDDLVQMATFHNKVVWPHVQRIMSEETEFCTAKRPDSGMSPALVRLSLYLYVLHAALGLQQGQSSDLTFGVAGCGMLSGDLSTGLSLSLESSASSTSRRHVGMMLPQRS
jgi:hypothetical protein